MMRFLGHISVPLAVFLALALLAMLSRDVLWQVSANAFVHTQGVLRHVLEIALWLSGAFLINRLLGLLFWDGVMTRVLGKAPPRLLRDCLAFVVYAIAITGIIGLVFDLPVSGLLATSGVFGIVLGIALRNIILDVFTGIAVNIDQSYRIGDWVDMLDRGLPERVYGKVVELNWRTTRIETLDHQIVVVPNSRMGTTVFTNLSITGAPVRFGVEFCLDFSVPAERAIRVLLGGVTAVCGLRDGPEALPAPDVVIAGTTPLGIDYRVRYYQYPGKAAPIIVRSRVAQSVVSHLASAGLSLAYPKQDLFHARMPTRHLDSESLTDRVALLGRAPILKESFDQEELRIIASAMSRQFLAAGACLVAQGEQSDSMFVVGEGLLRAYVVDGGRRVALDRLQPGEIVGEMSLLTGDPRSATVLAETEAMVYEITRADLMPILERRPRSLETISRVVAERRLRTSEAVASAASELSREALQTTAAHLLQRMRGMFRGLFERAS